MPPRSPGSRMGGFAFVYQSATLGDVLYTNPLRAPIPEAEWTALVQAIAGGD